MLFNNDMPQNSSNIATAVTDARTQYHTSILFYHEKVDSAEKTGMMTSSVSNIARGEARFAALSNYTNALHGKDVLTYTGILGICL